MAPVQRTWRRRTAAPNQTDALRDKLRLEAALPLAEAEKKCVECHDLDNSINFHVEGAFDKYWKQIEPLEQKTRCDRAMSPQKDRHTATMIDREGLFSPEPRALQRLVVSPYAGCGHQSRFAATDHAKARRRARLPVL